MYASTVAVTVAWAVTVFWFNAGLGTNYGFLNAKPSTASVLDLLGPWPWYVVTEIVLVTTVWALITLPWTVAERGARRSAPDGFLQTAVAAGSSLS